MRSLGNLAQRGLARTVFITARRDPASHAGRDDLVNRSDLVASANSGIQRFPDLRGKRIAIPPNSSAQYESFWFLAEHYGLSTNDIRALPMSEQAANFAMSQGQVDAIFRVRAPGNPVIRQLIGDQNMRIIPLAQAEALALKRPSIGSGKIPVGSYRGEPALPHHDLVTPVLDRLLVARSDLDPEIAFQITRDLFEKRADIVAQNRLAGLIAALPDDADSVLPAHPGSRRYYDREKPGFVQRNARFASAILYTVVILFSALVALRAQWQKARRVRMSKFNHQLVALAEQLRNRNSTQELASIKFRLLEILTEVMKDLDSNKVSQAEFEHFSFTWQAVDTMARDQMLLGDLPATHEAVAGGQTT